MVNNLLGLMVCIMNILSENVCHFIHRFSICSYTSVCFNKHTYLLTYLLECRFAGTGTFGRVVLVQHTPSEDYFALKMLTISEVLKLKQVDHVKNEKEVLSTVRHPFIVNMYGPSNYLQLVLLITKIEHSIAFRLCAIPRAAPYLSRYAPAHSTLDRRPSLCCACHFAICQAIVQHCRTSDLELTATCCVKLRLSLSTFKSRLELICFLLLSANCSNYLFRQRLCSRLTALWRYINFVLLLLLLLLLLYTIQLENTQKTRQ